MLPVGILTQRLDTLGHRGRLHQTILCTLFSCRRVASLIPSSTNQAPSHPTCILRMLRILTTHTRSHLHINRSLQPHLTSIHTLHLPGSLEQPLAPLSVSIVHNANIPLVRLVADVLLVRSSTTGYGLMKKNSAKLCRNPTGTSLSISVAGTKAIRRVVSGSRVTNRASTSISKDGTEGLLEGTNCRPIAAGLVVVRQC